MPTVIYEPFALLGLWLDAAYPDNESWDADRLHEAVLEYGAISFDDVLTKIKDAGLAVNLEQIKLGE